MSEKLSLKFQELGARLNQNGQPLDFGDWKSECLSMGSGPAIHFRDDLGIITVAGKDRLRFLQGLLTNDLNSLEEGGSTEACLLDSKAKVVAHLCVYRGLDTFFLILEEDNLQKVSETLDLYTVVDDVKIFSEKQSLIFSLLNSSDEFTSNPRFPILKTHWENLRHDLMVVSDDEPESFLSSLEGDSWTWMGTRAFELLRMEEAQPIFSKEVGEGHLIMEVPYFMKSVSYTKGCFLGQEPVSRMHHRGGEAPRKWMLMESQEEMEIGTHFFSEDQEVGSLVSCSYSPIREKYLGTGFLNRSAAKPGAKISLGQNPKNVEAVVLGFSQTPKG